MDNNEQFDDDGEFNERYSRYLEILKLIEDMEDASDEEYEEILEKLKDNYYELTGQDFDDDSIINYKMQLDDEDDKKMFDDLIKNHNMTLTLDLECVEDVLLVSEHWESDSGISTSRYYEYDPIIIANISPDIQMEIYQKAMEYFVEKELYTEAAEARDILNDMKNEN